MLEILIGCYLVIAIIFFMVAVTDRGVELTRKTAIQFTLISLVWPIALGLYIFSK